MQHKKVFIIASVIILFLAISGASCTASETASLVIGGKPVNSNTPPLVKNKTVYIPVDTLKVLKASVENSGKRNGDEQKIDITRWDGRKIPCKAVYIDGKIMVPITDIASDIGTVIEWLDNGRTVSIKAQVENIDFDGSQLKVSTSYPVSYKVDWWAAKNRLIVEMTGAAFPSRDSDLTISNSTSVGIRIGSDNGTARIVLDMPNDIKHKVASASLSAIVNVSISGLASAQQAPVNIASEPISSDIPQDIETTVPAVPPVQLPPAVIKDIDYEIDGKHGINVIISTDSPVKYLSYMFRQPDKLVIDIQNSLPGDGIKDKRINHEILKSIEVEKRFQNLVRVSMDLSRLVCYSITTDSSRNKLQISLDLPKGAGGSLSDKIVVIDPGHGGPTKIGTKACNGTREKTLTLAIAKKVQEILKEAGVCALLTRDSDIELDKDLATDLRMRPEFAARNSADLFISIHCNALSSSKKISGTETFYHGKDVNGRALAECIHSELLKAIGLPDRKVKSDYSLYSNGFAVLRGSSERFNIPAILIETGFIDNPCDSEIICNPAYQQKIAEAIVRGLKTYVEGNSKDVSSTRHKNSSISKKDIKKPSVTVSKAGNTSAVKAKSDNTINGLKRPGEN